MEPNRDCLHDIVQAQLDQNPDATALLAPGLDPLPYGDLSDQIDYVGGAIRNSGIQRSGRVAVVLPNGPDMATAFLGVAAFATCAPLNPQFRREELEFYLADLQAQAVIVPAEIDSPARDVARQLKLTVLELASATDQPAGRFRFEQADGEPAEVLDCGRAEDVALVLHTSGTTSRPKLVPLSHRNLCASARNIGRVLELTPQDRCLNVMPLFHIHGLIGALLSSLHAGASIVCSPGYQDDAFPDWIDEFESTWYSAVPTIHQAVLAQARLSDSRIGSNRLRFIRSSSSALPPTVMADLEKTFNVPVIESYGMTEAAHQMASNPLPPADRKPGCVGLPAGPKMAIMDDDGNLLGSGETGEIVIRGENVTTGYENNQEANEAAFTNGWFRTGDRGRIDDDGYFYITGRTKEMINRGGENISPREIDEVLLEHEAVAQAVAFAVPHDRLGEDVVAAVVANDDASATEQDLREFALSRLADFKVPSQILFVSEIPKGPTGKLQRIGLHEKLSDLLRPEFVAAETVTEEALTELWREVLAEEQIGIHDNFFGLGGDSLMATRLMARINTRFDLELAVESVFRAPTLTGQAGLIESALIDQIERGGN